MYLNRLKDLSTSSSVFISLSNGEALFPLAGPETLRPPVMHYDNGGEISISLSNTLADNASKRRRRHSF